MKNNFLQITHCADIQVKDRNQSLFAASEHTLKSIEEILTTNKNPIHIISGDLFEFATANDSERKLIYNHIARLISIPTLKEIFIIAGNHDLIKDNKAIESQKNNNPISIFTDVIKYFDSDKIRYCSKSGVYNSRVFNELRFVVYSLEDGEEFWECIKEGLESENNGIKFCLFHAMIREYVDYDKLPVRPDIYNKLKNLELFPNNSLITAGDIHKTLIFEDAPNQKRFIYPGSTMQHTFSEGTYLSVGDSIKTSEAERKNIIEYCIPLDANNKLCSSVLDISIKKHIIPDSICYTTITLDSKVPYAVIKDNLGKLILKEGQVTNNIKVKSSNIFISKEHEIYDLMKSKLTKANISFEYDKFIQSTEVATNKVLQSVIDEQSAKQLASSNNTDIISEDTLDNLLLSEEQLHKLFDSVLEPLVDKVSSSFESEITAETIHEEILNLFKTELNKTSEQSSARYNIMFDSIETNGFMYLDANRIDLDIPGIVRILGTNGIGKTTLFRMLRWCITGMAFENMSANQVVKNNLLVFNNKLTDNNFVLVKLATRINRQVVIMNRSVTRTWKQNITDEQKLSQNWMDFVADVKRDFKLEIVAEDGSIKTYTGENAEKTVLRWFGSTVDNILFLNQAKIETILKSNSNKLNELILQYIGVDYLQKLEQSLDTVKGDLFNIEKPRRKREEINEAIIDTDIAINKVFTELEDKKSEITHYEQKQKQIETCIEEQNNNLIKFGDIPSLIQEEENKFNHNIIELSKYDDEDLNEKEMKVFDLKKPVIDSVLIQKYEQSLLKLTEEQVNHKNNILSFENKKVKLSDNIDNVCASIVNKATGELDALTKLESSNNKEISDIYLTVADYYKDINNQLKAKEEEKFQLKVAHQTNIKTFTNRISEIKEQIESGICPTCKRPFDISIEDFENHKILLLEEIKSLEEKITEEQQFIFTLDEWFDKALKVKTKQADLERLATQEKYNVFETENKTLLQYKTIIDGLLVNREASLKEKNDKLLFIDQASKISNIKYSQYILSQSVLDLKEVSDLIVSQKEYDSLIKEETNLVETCSTAQVTLEQKIKTIKGEYTDALTQYTNASEAVTKYNETVNVHNNRIKDVLRTIESIKDKQKVISVTIKSLNQKKPEYEKLIELRDTLTTDKHNIDNELKLLRTDINSLNIKKVSYENQKVELRKEYDNYLKYVKNDYIWKLYQKLIKSNFKDIVFDYYRNYLNNTLNYLLSDVNFKLYWDKNSDLTMISCDNGIITYQSVQQTSGMEITFLGLSLIYTIHVLNVKNSVSHIFLDELSGTLNKGKELSYSAADYQELFIKILSKFKNKTIFIIDHSIDNLFETVCYEVVPQINCSKYVKKD